MIENILKTLNFDEDEIKTYFLLLELGPVTAGVLAKKMGVPRSSLYGFLKRLGDHGLVTESQKRGVKTFIAENPEQINFLFRQKIEQLQKSQEDFKKVLPGLKRAGEKYASPKFQAFEGQPQLQLALKDMLLYNNLETLAFWPQKKMVEMLSPDFFRYHNKERIKNNLSVRAIWPQKQVIDIKVHPYFGDGPEFLRQIKIAPSYVDAAMGYWIYGPKVVLISSLKESFGFTVQSLEFAEMLKTQFEALWNLSESFEINPQDTKPFLDQLKKFA